MWDAGSDMMVQGCSAVHCTAVECSAVYNNPVQCSAVEYDAMQISSGQESTVQ